MELVPATADHLEPLKAWFGDREAAYQWGGPGLRFPFTDESFLKDIRWGKMPAWSAVDDAGALLGFGQYYEKDKCCHLARLGVAPEVRGRGFGKAFISELMGIGMKQLGVDASSLFVLMDNPAALRCYLGLGFEFAGWPHWMEPIDGVRFMVNKTWCSR